MRTLRPLGATATALLGLCWPLVPAAHGATPEAAAKATTCHGHRATIVGTRHADHLVGTPHRDVIVALGGDDVIVGRGGDDLICAGAGNDRVRAGAGGDVVFGGRGNDVLKGQRGADRLVGEGGDDRLLGGLDQTGYDRGGLFDYGDLLIGGAGNDYLDPGYDPETAKAERDSGEISPDEVSYADAPRGVRVDLTRATRSVPGSATGRGSDRIVWGPFMEVAGSPGPDVILGSAGADNVQGGAGDDRLVGGAGNDTIEDNGHLKSSVDTDTVDGGAGNDDLYSDSGSDVVDGGDGNDTITEYGLQPTHLLGGAGNDQLNVDYGSRLTGFARSVVDGGDGRDLVYLQAGDPDGKTGTFGVDEVTGTISRTDAGTVTNATLAHAEVFDFLIAAPWTFVGTNAPESIDVDWGTSLHADMRGGDDRVTGGSGPDWVDGGDGNDTVAGGAGDDTCVNTETQVSCHS